MSLPTTATTRITIAAKPTVANATRRAVRTALLLRRRLLPRPPRVLLLLLLQLQPLSLHLLQLLLLYGSGYRTVSCAPNSPPPNNHAPPQKLTYFTTILSACRYLIYIIWAVNIPIRPIEIFSTIRIRPRLQAEAEPKHFLHPDLGSRLENYTCKYTESTATHGSHK